jgi:hypothetical protein
LGIASLRYCRWAELFFFAIQTPIELTEFWSDTTFMRSSYRLSRILTPVSLIERERRKDEVKRKLRISHFMCKGSGDCDFNRNLTSEAQSIPLNFINTYISIGCGCLSIDKSFKNSGGLGLGVCRRIAEKTSEVSL